MPGCWVVGHTCDLEMKEPWGKPSFPILGSVDTGLPVGFSGAYQLFCLAIFMKGGPCHPDEAPMPYAMMTVLGVLAGADFLGLDF